MPGVSMAETTFTFQVDEGLKDAFAEAAKGSDRTGAELLRDFMRDYVRDQVEAAAYDRWFRREVEAAIAEADAGNVVSSDDVEADADIWRAEMQRRLNGAAS